MVAVRMVQPPIDEIIDVVTMGDRLMAAAWAMATPRLTPSRPMLWRTAIGIRCSYFHHVLIDASVLHMMQMAVFDIVDVTIVSNRGVIAAWPVNMGMIGRRHSDSFPAWRNIRPHAFVARLVKPMWVGPTRSEDDI
jgi:hypothetical protein